MGRGGSLCQQMESEVDIQGVIDERAKKGGKRSGIKELEGWCLQRGVSID